MEEVSHTIVRGNNIGIGQVRGLFSNASTSGVRVRLINDSKHLIYLMLAASAIGQGSRMLYQGIFAPGTSYVPSGIDLAFDWGILLTFGVFVLINQLVKVHKGVSA
jgi:hypothetical protein